MATFDFERAIFVFLDKEYLENYRSYFDAILSDIVFSLVA